MLSTPRMGHPYPELKSDKWYDTFVSLVSSIDASGFAAREDRNLTVLGGSGMSVDEEGSVTWEGDIYIVHPNTGFKGVIDTQNSGIQLQDGGIVYVTIVRSPNSNYFLQLQTTTGKIPNNDNAFVVFVRKDDQVWFRGGELMELGGSPETTTYKDRRDINLCLNESQGEGYRILGRSRVDFSPSTEDGEVDAKVFIEGQTISDGIAGNVSVLDVTGVENELAKFRIDSSEPQEFAFDLNDMDPEIRRVIEVRGGLESDPSPQIVQFRITNSDLDVTYSFSVDGVGVFSYVSSVDDSTSDVALALSLEINGGLSLSAESDGDIISVTGEPGESFEFNISAIKDNINETENYTELVDVQNSGSGAPYNADQRILVWSGSIDISVST